MPMTSGGFIRVVVAVAMPGFAAALPGELFTLPNIGILLLTATWFALLRRRQVTAARPPAATGR